LDRQEYVGRKDPLNFQLMKIRFAFSKNKKKSKKNLKKIKKTYRPKVS
jgi:hypothetical protein